MGKKGLFIRIKGGSVISVSLYGEKVLGARYNYDRDVAGVIATLSELQRRYG
jgi:hypothetical protein